MSHGSHEVVMHETFFFYLKGSQYPSLFLILSIIHKILSNFVQQKPRSANLNFVKLCPLYLELPLAIKFLLCMHTDTYFSKIVKSCSTHPKHVNSS